MNWALSRPVITTCVDRLLRGRATIFMLHRVRCSRLGNDGHDPQAVKRILEYLRREKYEILGLGALVLRLLGYGRPVERAVAFTIDDGYLDVAEEAVPLFAEYDCPVTVFVATGFVDGAVWFWWDQIEFIFRTTKRHALTVGLAGRELRYALSTATDRRVAVGDFTARCKIIENSEKESGIARLAARADVEVPNAPPVEYGPMTWSQVRACEGRGMTFAPHTVSHPILSRTTDIVSRDEITRAWQRVQAEASRPVALFAYPNGGCEDFGSREMETLESLGFVGAVSAIPNYADAGLLSSTMDARYAIPRFGLPETLEVAIRHVAGVDRLREVLRIRRTS